MGDAGAIPRGREKDDHARHVRLHAPHIYQAVRSSLRDSKKSAWHQTLDPKEALPDPEDADSNKAGDLHEKSIINGLKRVAGTRFRVRVREHRERRHIRVGLPHQGGGPRARRFWLSSGNWQSSNQPEDRLPRGRRGPRAHTATTTASGTSSSRQRQAREVFRGLPPRRLRDCERRRG